MKKCNIDDIKDLKSICKNTNKATLNILFSRMCRFTYKLENNAEFKEEYKLLSVLNQCKIIGFDGKNTIIFLYPNACEKFIFNNLNDKNILTKTLSKIFDFDIKNILFYSDSIVDSIEIEKLYSAKKFNRLISKEERIILEDFSDIKVK